ncbi:MAG: TolC family outer membrane protein [Pseudomonadota bacterium]
MRQITFILGLLLAGSAVAESDQAAPKAYNLAELAPLAKQHDPQFIEAEANYFSNREVSTEARAALLPQVDASIGRTETETEFSGVPATSSPSSASSSLGLAGEYTTDNMALNLRQPLYNHGAWAGYSAAKAQVDSAQARYTAAEQALLLRLAERYFAALTAEDTLRFAKAEREAIARQLSDVERRFEVGSIPETDVKESRAAYDLAEAEVIAAENALRNAREALYITVGRDVALRPLRADLEYTLPEPDDVEAWQKAALQGNAALVAAQANYEASSDEVSARRAQHYPSLDLLASKTKNDFVDGQYEGLESDETRITVQLSIPLYSGGATQSGVRSATARRDAAQRLLDYQRLQARQDARNAFYDLKAASSRAQALSVAVESRIASREAIRDGFEAGTRTSTDVLDAEREVRRTQRDHARARYNYLLARLRLEQATGALDGEDLAALDGLMGE